MTSYQINGNEFIIGGNRHEFVNPVAEVVEFPDSIIIRLKLTGQEPPEMQRNVIAFDRSGREKWRIEKNPGFDHHSPYSSIRKVDDELWAYHPTGMDYRIDRATGEIIDKVFKR